MPASGGGKHKVGRKKKKTGAGTKKQKAGKKSAPRNRNMPQNEETFIYILQSAVNEKKSYVGVTNSLPWRLRQHNGDLAGGA